MLRAKAALLAALALVLAGCSYIAPQKEPELVAQLIPNSYVVQLTVVNAPEVEGVDWHYGDGTQELGTQKLSVSHEYPAPGEYTATAVLYPLATQDGGSPGAGPGPASRAPFPESETPPPVVVSVTFEIPPIVPIEITDIEIEVVTPPPWWTPGGPDHYPEGTPLRFKAIWKDYVESDDIAPYTFRWWAIRVSDAQTMWYGEGEEATCPGLYSGSSCGTDKVAPYRILVVMYCTDGSTYNYEETIFIEPTGA